MNRLMKLLVSLTPLCTALLTSGVAHATVLNFEGVGNFAAVNNFYNGGTDSVGNSGTNYGIEFSSNSLGLIDADAGGDGNFANEPTPSTILFFLSGGAATMNVAAGFDTGFSFFYSSLGSAFVNVWSGLGASGDLLATLNLVQNYSNNCSGDPNGDFCHWDPIGVNFNGVAHSVDFGGSANLVGFDDITLGSAIPGTNPNPIPLPAAAWLFGSALAGMGTVVRRRQTLA